MTLASTNSPRRTARVEEPEWVVWAVVIAMLAIGLLVRGAVEGRTEHFSGNGVTFSYPAAWSALSVVQDGTIIHVTDAFAADLAPAGIAVQQLAAADLGRGEPSLGDMALMWSNRRSQDLLGYSALGVAPVKVRGKDAVAVDYAYVVQPPGTGMPAVVRAQDVLLRSGAVVTIVTFSAAADAYEKQAGTWQMALASLDVQ